MPRYVALLGSVNVGGRRIKMDVLRLAVASLGHENVETFIASGNVLFTSLIDDPHALETSIEARLKQEFGYEVPTYVRTGPELAQVIAYRPFAASDHDDPANTLYVTFLRNAPAENAESNLKALATVDDEFAVRGREMYWLRRKKISESKITPAMFRKAAPVPGTSRNITTVRTLAKKCE